MKYAIYDKAADGYLTKLEFEHDVPAQTLGLICGYNEYITEAKLLDTKEEAVAVITRIESNKFMEKGRFVIHSFDDGLGDQYIISETGKPTKVVDDITVDLDGTINVKYGTMVCHWSASSLEYAINRMNRLQEARSPKYSAWRNTFDIYKVITVMDERTKTHYQFIKVTKKGLDEFVKDEEEKLLVAGNEIINTTSLLNKRIEELEKANYDLGERGIIADRLQEENDKLKTKVESIKKEARDWKNLYESADEQRTILKDVIDTIYTDLKSETTCNDLKDTLRLLEHNPDFDHIYMPTKVSCILDDKDFLTAKDEIRSIINKMITIIESRDLNQSIAFSSAEEAIRYYTKCNEALGEWKRKYETMRDERDKALERAEFYKRQANSVYGMSMPTRCCGKQLMADILSGKKIPIDKKKYDSLMECVNNISLTYEMMKLTPFSMDRPSWLSGIINRIKDLTK